MRTFCIFSGILFSFILTSCRSDSDTASITKPNIVLIFTDDQGYGDLGCYGATGYKTPHLDALASEGMRFTHFYSAQPVCSASRAGLLTGCYPNRIGFSGALFPYHRIGLNPDELTLAEMLKEQGYATAAFGKWHLGHHKEFLPLQHGFDEYLGLPYSNDMWPLDDLGQPFPHNEGRAAYPPLPLIEGNETIEQITSLEGQDRLTTLYTERAVDFIHRKAGNPFFLYVPHTMPHVPLGVSEKFRGQSEQGRYGDVMMEIDWSVGQILQALKDKGIEDQTLIIFTTDNGPWLNYGNHAGSAGGLREGKTTSWEGGQRVPFVVKWTGHVKEGTICNKLACAIDLLPTLAEITGGTLSENEIDGVSLAELWKGNLDAEPRKELFYYYGRNHLNAVRKGNWKLVLPHTWDSYHMPPGKDGVGGPRKRMKVEEPELYNMRRDPGEQFNVIEQYPEIARELTKLAEKARTELGDLNIGLEKGSGTREIGKL
jgi:arylsulfatase A-like enzyme